MHKTYNINESSLPDSLESRSMCLLIEYQIEAPEAIPAQILSWSPYIMWQYTIYGSGLQ